MMMEVRQVCLEHMFAFVPCYSATRGQGVGACRTAQLGPPTCISPAAAAEIIMVARRAFGAEQPESQPEQTHQEHGWPCPTRPNCSKVAHARKLWNKFVSQHIGSRSVLQVAIMYARFDIVMGVLCCTITDVIGPRDQAGAPQHRTAAEPGQPAEDDRHLDQVLPGAVLPNSGQPSRDVGTCAVCGWQRSPTYVCWLCGRDICPKCCLPKDTRCHEVDGCRAARQRELNQLSATNKKPLQGLWFAPTDGKGRVQGSNAGHSRSTHEPNDVIVVEHLAKAFEHYRTTAGGPEQQDNDDDE